MTKLGTPEATAGPGAPAFLYVRRDVQDRLRSPIQGWFGQRDQFEMGPRYEPAAGIERFLAKGRGRTLVMRTERLDHEGGLTHRRAGDNCGRPL